MIKDILKEVESLDQRIDALQSPAPEDDAEKQLLGEEPTVREDSESLEELEARRTALLEQCRDLTSADRVFLARHQGRPRVDEYSGATVSAAMTRAFSAVLPGTRVFRSPCWGTARALPWRKICVSGSVCRNRTATVRRCA